uniref:DNA polymerase delta subunit 3 n=1 Tax=Magallana gigas TaxID=29159 RepID=K1R212_MAGGI
MLYTFVEEQKKKKIHVAATYFVSGMCKSVDGCQTYTCTVIPEEELETFKNSLTTVHSIHVYSVQKAGLKDSNSLYLADYDCVKENLFEIHKSIKYGKAQPSSEAKRPPIKTAQEETKVSGTSSAASTNGHSSSNTKKDAKTGGIAGMFANAATKKADASKKQEIKAETNGTTTAGKADKKNQKDAKKGVANFFANHTGKKAAPKTVEVKKEENEEEAEKKKDTKPKQNGKGKRSKQARNGDSDEEGNKKKRRRIRIEMSESSEEEMDYESPVPSPVPSPTREPSPVPDTPEKESPKKLEVPVKPSQNGEKHRKRRRKLVPKTFMDEDGYMVTEKVWESESTDASDAEPPPVKETPKPSSPQMKKTYRKMKKRIHHFEERKPPHLKKKKASPKKKSPPSTGSKKQTSLSSFFTKK